MTMAMAAGVCGPGLKPHGGLPGFFPTAVIWDGAPILSFCNRASGQWALHKVWIASPYQVARSGSQV